jgi:UDP-N-acetylglucosamine 4-epimerase
MDADAAPDQVYNVACGQKTTLNELFTIVRDELVEKRPGLAPMPPIYEDFRPGDVRHSLADVGKIGRHMGYVPHRMVADGISEAIDWYIANDKVVSTPKRVIPVSSLPPSLTIVPASNAPRAD